MMPYEDAACTATPMTMGSKCTTQLCNKDKLFNEGHYAPGWPVPTVSLGALLIYCCFYCLPCIVCMACIGIIVGCFCRKSGGAKDSSNDRRRKSSSDRKKKKKSSSDKKKKKSSSDKKKKKKSSS